jgi:MerR family transcriptional regulator, mercuric resistance operon regulatory protein
MDLVLIGTVAEVTGVSTQAIRFYERRGLLGPADRLGNGYRNYDDDTVDRLGFIQSAQASGLTLDEIGSILTMRDAAQSPCDHVVRLLGDKLDEVRERQRQLARLEGELERLIDESTRMDPTDCADEDICQIITSARPREREVQGVARVSY